MIINYTDLKKKEVVNIWNGKNLGKINDLVIDSECGKILKIIVPGKKNGLFFCEQMEIRFSQITKIGDDAILVKLCENNLVSENDQRIEDNDE